MPYSSSALAGHSQRPTARAVDETGWYRESARALEAPAPRFAPDASREAGSPGPESLRLKGPGPENEVAHELRRSERTLRRASPRAGNARVLARAEHLRAQPGGVARSAPLRLERRPSDRQRSPRHSSRAGENLQGHLPPLQAHARFPLPPQGGLGYPRSAGGARDREGARHLRQAPDRAGGRHRGVHPAMPRVGDALHRSLGGNDRAHGILGEHARRLLHAGQRLHRVGVVASEAHLGPRPHVPGLQGGALRSAHRGHPFVPRGRAGVPGGRGSLGVRALPRSRCARHVLPRVDHHAVDPPLQPRAGRAPGSGLRLCPQRRRDAGARRRAGGRGAARRSVRDREGGQGRGAGRHAIPAPLRFPSRRGSDLPGVVCRLRDHRRRHRGGALRTRLRRGRREALPGPRDSGGPRGGARRPVPAGGDPGRGAVLQGSRPGAGGGAPRARTHLSRRDLCAQLPARMAHRRPAHLLRKARLVHPHLLPSRSPRRSQPADQLGAGDDPGRAVRQLAREQRRLGAVERTLLGHSAPGVDRRRRRLPLYRLEGGAGDALRAQPCRTSICTAPPSTR